MSSIKSFDRDPSDIFEASTFNRKTHCECLYCFDVYYKHLSVSDSLQLTFFTTFISMSSERVNLNTRRKRENKNAYAENKSTNLVFYSCKLSKTNQ